MTDSMKDKLYKYLSAHSAPILETAGTKCCELRYKPSCSNKGFIIAIGFSKNLHSTDPVDYIIGDTGYAIILPSYWLGIPVDLTYAYIEYFIDKYIRENIFSSGNNGTGDNNSNTNKPGCNCPNIPATPPHPPSCPKPPLENNVHDAPSNQLNGYFIASQ